MNPIQVETFLTIVRLGGLSKAANHLFVSQSTISQRLESIEKEYEVTLLNREKGVKSVSLTKEGERFYQIAMKYESLLGEAKNMKTISSETTITIGAVDSVHNYVLKDIYTSIIHEMPNVRMAIHTHQSNEIYALIVQRDLDIGFSLQERILRNIQVEKLFEEQMVLIQKKKDGVPSGNVKNEDFNPAHQLFINWGIEYQIWHEKHWGPTNNTHIQIDTPKLLKELLLKGDYWAIVPVSIARALHTEGWINVHLLEDSPPSRTCYHVEREGVNQSVRELSEFILQSKSHIEEIVRPWW
ncbi:LysR family transcriptional regulator [Sporosarcina luteola]|uniref:LysR family transcriptional regulator n=1 Tax=Sporosarcina luteola TaxID=582850 RepID=A0A511Z338_9BACL|nr:LysR family transcriptional regulator [Sporosarcina luteola]GEN81863.1 LysR family transcriptional regulator [Sporosarcina luteola]